MWTEYQYCVIILNQKLLYFWTDQSFVGHSLSLLPLPSPSLPLTSPSLSHSLLPSLPHPLRLSLSPSRSPPLTSPSLPLALSPPPQVWNLENMLPILALQRHEKPIQALAIYQDSFFTGSEDMEIKVRSCSTILCINAV